MFSRAIVSDKGIERQARAGEGWLANPRVVTNASAGNQTISINQVMSGVALFTGAAGAVNYTTPTAAALVAACPAADVGDTLVFALTNTAAQVATIVAGTGVTLAGFTTANAQTRMCIIRFDNITASSEAVTITSI